MTPIKKILRTHLKVYTVDWANQAELQAECPTASKASWVAFALAGYHQVSLEETDQVEEA